MNNDTTVNVQINATDSASGVVQNAASSFSNLWEQIALGQGALELAQKGFQLLEQTIVGSIQQAGDFQAQLVQLVTGAGESQSNLASVSAGIKQIAIDTGTTLNQLTQGMYLIESAGFHAANGGLDVLRAAAEGAKADGADLQTVANALTTVLHDYTIPASQAAQVTNMMVTAVASGKMHMQDFASSLSTVLPLAHQVGLSFAEVAGAEATLTAGGVDAAQATQDLSALIRTMQAPTLQQTQMMQQMGLSSLDLSQNLGKKGLTGTLQEISDAITQHMGPDGLVIQSTMANAKVATQDLQVMLQSMPPQLRGISNELLNGSISYKDYRKETQALPVALTNLAKQFETTYTKANSFNKLLTSGQPDAMTYANALKTITGQSDAANAAMLLTGSNAATFNENVKKVADAGKEAGKNIADWALIQGEFNQKWAQFQELMQVAAVNFGTVLITLIMSFGKLWDAIQPVLHIIAEIFRPALDGLKQALDNLAVAFDPIWQKIQGPVMEALQAFALYILGPVLIALAALLGAAYVFVKIATWIADAITWIINFDQTVKNYIGEAIDWIKQLPERIRESVERGLEDAANAFTHYWERLKANAPQWGRDIVHGIETGLLDLAKYDLDQIFNWYYALDNWWQEIDAWFHALPGRLENDLDTWWKSLKAWVHSTSKQLSTELDSWWQAFKTWIESIPGRLDKEYDTWWQATDAWLHSVPPRLAADLERWWDAIQAWVKSIPHRIVEQLTLWKNEIEQWFRNLPNQIMDSLKQSGQQMANQHTASFEQVWKDGKKIAEIAGIIIVAIIAVVVIVAAAIVFKFIQLGIQMISAILQGLIAAVKTLLSWFGQLAGLILRTLGDVKNWLYPVGRDIIQGMINGITGMAGAAGNAVKSVGQGAVNDLKKVLGIHSPSVVFAQIGENMGQGLIQGLQGIQAQANIATTQLVTGSPVVSSPTPVSNTVNNYTTSGGNRATINIQQLVVQAPNGATLKSILQGINQGSLNASQGLTPEAA